jgi:hypothetical protein
MEVAKIEDKDLYRIALDTRNFEITLFWQRCNYFLVLNSALAVGFFATKETRYVVLLAFVGLLTSALWFAVGLGGKFWQVRWEYRLSQIEKPGLDFFSADAATNKRDVEKSFEESRKSGEHGWLHRCLDWLVLTKPSVSFMMMLLPLVFFFAWGTAIVLSALSWAMTTSEIINAGTNGLIAIGTIAVAIFAIWGDSCRAWLYGPKLSLVLHIPSVGGSGRIIYFHLKVVNARQTVPATNCRVLLKRIGRQDSSGKFNYESLPVPWIFVWAPEIEGAPKFITLLKEDVLDFGSVTKGEDNFRPRLSWCPTNVPGLVQANETVRYGLEIVSDNFVSPRLQVFEVDWNGQWSDDLDVMANHLHIHEVTSEVPDTIG